MKNLAKMFLMAAFCAVIFVEGGWGQHTLTSTTLSANLNKTDTQFSVASAPTGTAVGWLAYVNREAMRIDAVSGNRLTVTRGYNQTQALNHTSGNTIYIDESMYFGLPQVPSGRCTAASDLRASPTIDTSTGEQYRCDSSVWTATGGAPAAFSQMIITSSNADALTVGPNGATNPAFDVNAATASAATGVGITAAAAAGGVAIVATSSGTNESLTLDAKGTGTVTLNGTATGNINLNDGTIVTDNQAAAFAVGPNGATNPGFQVDASTASAATGLKITAAAAAGGVAVAAISSGANEALTLNAKGTGTIGIGSVSTGAVTITPATTVTGTLAATNAATVGTTLAVTGATTLSGAVTQKAAVISGSGATATLTAAQSGSVVAFDRAAGIVFTLPAPAVGLYYDFLANVSVTSNSYKVITDAGTTFILGSLVNIDVDTGNAVAAWTGNGTTHVAITMNGTTTGGLLGTMFRLTCISSTVWMVQGIDQGNGTVATPFATS